MRHFVRGPRQGWGLVLFVIPGSLLWSLPASPADVQTAAPLITAGNGLPDGHGATLGRLFARVIDPAVPGAAYRLEAFLTSSISTAARPTCAGTSPEGCPGAARGVAMAYGNPSAIVGPVTYLKLAATGYLVPAGGAAAAEYPSFEMALEGTLYASPLSRPGDPADLHLILGNEARLLAWSAPSTAGDDERSFPHGTGAGVVFADRRFMLFPGWLRGEVVASTASGLLLRFTRAEMLPVRIGDATQVWLEPDAEAAGGRGLPGGSFLEMEVGLSPFGAPSKVIEGASTSDAELQVSYPPIQAAPAFRRGDCDGDGLVGTSLSDVLALLRYSYLGIGQPPCLKACDANGDGTIESGILDAVYALRYLFAGGPPPPAPFPECGAEPERSSLTCLSQAGCGVR